MEPQGSTVCLTVLVPAHAAQQLVDYLMTDEHADVEFSMYEVAARGPLVHLAREEDQVRGFARRTVARLLLDRDRCTALIGRLTELLAGLEGGYWITPVEGRGRFAGPVAQSEAQA
ncbi:MAG: DUF3240 family protein [Burkholderiales bacterium]|nr:DUF3240 family protein [Burkholderiales bacterium]